MLFKLWEKPKNSNRTLGRRTATGENKRIQILTQEVIRRLGNTTEGLADEEYQCMVDRFCQKLCNSRYWEEQMSSWDKRVGGKSHQMSSKGTQAKENCQGQLGGEDKDQAHREEVVVQEQEGGERLV